MAGIFRMAGQRATGGSMRRHSRARRKGYDRGAVDFLYKPIDPIVLRRKAAVFFELHRQRRQLADQLRQRSETLRLNEMFTGMLPAFLRYAAKAGSDVASHTPVLLRCSLPLESGSPLFGPAPAPDRARLRPAYPQSPSHTSNSPRGRSYASTHE